MHAAFKFDPDAIPDLIQAAVDTFDFTLPGEGGESLGRDLVVAAADGIAARSNRGLDVRAAAFKDNRPDYAEYKARRYDVDRPGELGGQMLSLTSLVGKPEVAADSIRMTYGTGTAPGRATARNGRALYPGELAATDRQKAEWFVASGREFYGLDEEVAERMLALAGERFTRHCQDVGLSP